MTAAAQKDMRSWRNITIGFIVIGFLFVIAGATAEALSEPLGIDFIMEPTSYFLLAVFFAVLSIAPISNRINAYKERFPLKG
jgi:hypothetical protein